MSVFKNASIQTLNIEPGTTPIGFYLVRVRDPINPSCGIGTYAASNMNWAVQALVLSQLCYRLENNQ